MYKAEITDWNCPESTAACALGATDAALDALDRLPPDIRRAHAVLIGRIRPHLHQGSVFGGAALLDIETLIETLRPLVDVCRHEGLIDYGDGVVTYGSVIAAPGNDVNQVVEALSEVLHYASRARDLIRARRAVHRIQDGLG